MRSSQHTVQRLTQEVHPGHEANLRVFLLRVCPVFVTQHCDDRKRARTTNSPRVQQLGSPVVDISGVYHGAEASDSVRRQNC